MRRFLRRIFAIVALLAVLSAAANGTIPGLPEWFQNLAMVALTTIVKMIVAILDGMVDFLVNMLKAMEVFLQSLL